MHERETNVVNRFRHHRRSRLGKQAENKNSISRLDYVTESIHVYTQLSFRDMYVILVRVSLSESDGLPAAGKNRENLKWRRAILADLLRGFIGTMVFGRG